MPLSKRQWLARERAYVEAVSIFSDTLWTNDLCEFEQGLRVASEFAHKANQCAALAERAPDVEYIPRAVTREQIEALESDRKRRLFISLSCQEQKHARCNVWLTNCCCSCHDAGAAEVH